MILNKNNLADHFDCWYFPNISRLMGFYLIALLPFLLSSVFASAQAKDFATSAAQALLIDRETGSILLEKQADMRIAPASLAKLMAAEVVFNALKTEKISLNDEYLISEDAWRRGGAPSRTTTMFASVKSKVSVNNLLQGLIVLQANDAALAFAEGGFGSEEAFVAKMNERAAEIGLKNSHFVNATGLPQEGQYTTLQDLVTLAVYMEKEYPQYMMLYAQSAFEWNKIYQRNRNPLLTANIGVYGLVNGFTQGQGYAILLSVKKDDKHLLLALAGISKEKDRNEEAKRILGWAMSEFVTRLVFDEGETIGYAALFGGGDTSIGLKVNERVGVLIAKTNLSKLEAKITYNGPIIAPVKMDEEVGQLKIFVNGEIILAKPVFTAETAAEASVTQKAKNALYELSIGWIRAYWH